MGLKKSYVKGAAAFGLCLGLSGCVVMDDTGLWQGSAVSQQDYNSYNCSMEMDMSHFDDQISIHHITTDCGGPRVTWRPGSFEVRGTTVWRGDKIVGWTHADGSTSLDLDDPNVDFDDRYPYPAHRVTISWMQVGGTLEYSEDVYFANRVQRTRGTLRRR